MKIAIGYKEFDKEKSWGGGLKFATNLKNFLNEKEHKVVNDLKDNDIDIILITDPRPKSASASFNHFDVEKYIQEKPETKVLLRINECDERKGTKNVNYFINQASKVCDHLIFLSEWLKKTHSINKNSSVILNGADKNIFKNYENSKKNKKLKIVTHHWSSNYNKGFKYYYYLDRLLKNEKFSNFFSFSYIGNLPKNSQFKNTEIYKPLNGKELAKKLSEHDIYLTASINEPGGNHQNEGLNCGLPVLFINSGCMPEYCNDYGEQFFDFQSFEDKLFLIHKNYDEYKNKCKNYPYNSEFTCKEYYKLFKYILSENTKNSKKGKKKFYTFTDKLKFFLNKFFNI